MEHVSVQQMFSRTASAFSADLAIENGHKRISYEELAAKADKVSDSLLAASMARGDIVAILAQDVTDVIAAIIGILKAGGVFCPLDPSFPEKRLRAMISGVLPKWYVIESRFLRIYELLTIDGKHTANVVCIDEEPAGGNPGEAVLLDDSAGVTQAENGSRKSAPDDMCSIYFTSGSTGLPKPIAGRLKGIDHFVRWEIQTLGVGPGTRVSQLASPSFDGFLKDVFVPLCAGGVVCAHQDRKITLDAPGLIRWIEEQKIEILQCVPSVFRSILGERLDPSLFSALRCVVMAGEPLLPVDVKKWMDVFNERIQLVNLYGPTETTVTKLFHFVQASDADRRTIPIGKPMEGAAAIVVDDDGQPCAAGSIGEIYIRTPFRALGYYGLPELTKEVFIPNPFNNDPNDVVYKTGDYGRKLEDGNFEFLGRRDHQVKIRGVRIEIGEIEDVLRRHRLVKEAAVIDLEDVTGNKYLCAFVIMDHGADAGELREYLASHLPESMVPSVFVQTEAFPRTLSGKVDRNALSRSKPDLLDAETVIVHPRTPVEEILAGIWAQVLGLKQVHIHRNFFEVGGHSLLATQVISRVREAFHVELPLRSIFEAPTVAKLAAAVEAAVGATPSIDVPLRRVPRDLQLPPSLAQERLWFLDQLAPGLPINNFPYGLTLRGPMNLPAMEQSLNEVFRRQESLRTSFHTQQGRPIQLIAPALNASLPVIDLSGLPEDDRGAIVTRLAEEDARRPFGLSEAPLIRTHLLRSQDHEHVFLTTMHHIITDVWSFEVLIGEVVQLYEALRSGSPSPLEELPIQYADYSDWQRRFLQGDVSNAQLAYWEKQLAGSQGSLDLSTDRPRQETPGYAGAAYWFSLPEPLTESLKALSREHDVTLFMTLLAGFQALFHRYTGQDDIVVGSPVTTRSRPELENLIGFFVNTLALRTDLSGNPSFAELLARVRSVTMGAYANQDLPFSMVVERLNHRRQSGYSPLFRAWFLLDHIPVQKSGISDIEVGFLPFVETKTAQFDLTLNMLDLGSAIRGILIYKTDLFDRDTIVELSEHFETLLTEAAAHPDRRILDLPLFRQPLKIAALT